MGPNQSGGRDAKLSRRTPSRPGCGRVSRPPRVGSFRVWQRGGRHRPPQSLTGPRCSQGGHPVSIHLSGPAKPGQPRERRPPPAPPPPPWWRSWILAVGILLTILLFFPPSMTINGKPTHKYAYSDFLNQVTTNQVRTATIASDGHVTGTLTNGDKYTSQIPTAVQDAQLLPLLKDHKVQIKATAAGGITFAGVILNLLPPVLFSGFWIFLGWQTNRQLAGVGASRVPDLFSDARKRAPSIIFIDEIDAIGARRGVGVFSSNDEREQTLNQLLAEMDGFDKETGVVVMAATNRPESLDPALLRAGRFDRTVEIPLPNQAERRAILAVHARDKQLSPAGDLDVVARGTPGFSGADLANLVNEAAINAVRESREVLTAHDFDAARDRIILGRRDASNALTADEKHSVAVHESGHTVVAVFSDHADPVAKVTILPSGMALGVTEQLPESERHLYQESYLYDSLAIRLGGRAAEVLVLGEASPGAANDLAGATQLATRMVRDWGMSPKLGPVGFSNDGPNYLGLEDPRPRAYAEQTQRLIDEEVSRLLREAEQRATQLLPPHRDTLDRLVELLLEKETVDGSEVYAIAGRAQPSARGVVEAPVAVSRAVAATGGVSS